MAPTVVFCRLMVVARLNASGGWRRADGEGANELWLRYLTPVLAETRESAAALAIALDEGLPGAFEPPIDPPAETAGPPIGLLTMPKSLQSRKPPTPSLAWVQPAP